MITKEANSQRKSHRVDLPLYVEIDGKAYSAKDWSTTGVGLTGLEKALEPGAILPVKLIFPMVESALTLAARLIFKVKRGDTFGFEFHELSARNKRVLRHYIELAVEGKLENLEDMVAITTAPGIRSPIEDALNLTELESEGMLKEFKKKSYLAIVLGVLLLATVIGLLFYNTVYKIEATGFISGNIERVTANNDGRVLSIWVQPNTYVDANTALFAIDAPNLKTEIEALEQQLKQLAAVPQKTDQARETAEADLLSSLRKEYEQRKTEFANAEHLYQKQIISNKDLLLAENRYYQIRTDYLREVANGVNKTMTRQASDLYGKLKMELEAKKILRAHQVSAQTVRSPHKGRIFRIDKTLGEYAIASDPVVLLESDVTPVVLVRLRNDDVLKLHIGMLADIYVPFEGKKYQALVSAVGHAAVNADITSSMESSLNETLVKLDFVDKQVRLPANTRVKVWIKTFGGG